MKNPLLLLGFLLSANLLAGSLDSPRFGMPTSLAADTLDELVLRGIRHIDTEGESFSANAGTGKQAYDVNYTLFNPRNRLHLLRADKALPYFCRELLAYFRGSLNVEDGLAQAASTWRTLADEDGNIASNYGHYVFHQRVPGAENMTQYEWVIHNLTRSKDSRKALININQPHHKKSSAKDFPCTIGLQFFVRNNHLCCVVSSRSTDIYTGLPYDMGFFAFLTELVYADLKEHLPKDEAAELKLGYVTMKTTFTQIYDKTRTSALCLLKRSQLLNAISSDNQYHAMPAIESARETLQDIYNGTCKTAIMQWIHKHA